MTDIEQTQLPGVGVRYDFITEDGQRVGVVHHRTGRREVFFCPVDDPDSAILAVNLTDEDVHTLVDMLGGSRVVESVAQATQHIEGLAIDWLAIERDSPYAGRTIGEARVRTRTGVSVVAILRGDQPQPAPGPEAPIEAGDTLVVVGTSEGIEAVREILHTG
jgi:TrkA domain protein